MCKARSGTSFHRTHIVDMLADKVSRTIPLILREYNKLRSIVDKFLIQSSLNLLHVLSQGHIMTP
jgi:hypothetical protein